MATTAPRAVEGRASADNYPVLLRIGTQNARTIKLSFAPVDVAVARDGTAYVLIRSSEARPVRPRTYFEVVPPGAEGGDHNLVPVLDGTPLTDATDTRLPGAAMCVLADDRYLLSTDEFANCVVRTDIGDGSAEAWGDAGGEPGQLDAPAGIGIDAEGNVWVVSTRSHRIQRFTPDGRFIDGFGEFGTGQGKLNYPWGLACDPFDSSILVADWRNDRIQRFRQDGSLLQVIGPGLRGLEEPLNRPSGVSVDQYGDIYVTDRANDRVLLLNHRGDFIESLRGDAMLPQPAIERLMQFRDQLRRRDQVTALERERRLRRPISARPDHDDLVYITDSAHQRLQTYRKIVRALGPDEVAPPDGLEDPMVYV